MDESRSYCKRLGDKRATLNRISYLIGACNNINNYRGNGHDYDKTASDLIDTVMIEMSNVLNAELDLIAKDSDVDQIKAGSKVMFEAITVDDYNEDMY